MNEYTNVLGYIVLTALSLAIIGGCLLAIWAGVVVLVRWVRR